MIFVFGYIRPQKSELLVREFEEYNGIYCALCRSLGREYGPFARLALNYDCTFYALLLFALSSGGQPGFSKGRCVVNPLKKCFFCRERNNSLSSAAALTIILAYYKVCDDVADSGFFRSLFARFSLLFLHHAHKKADTRYPKLEKAVSKAMRKQQTVEIGNSPGVDLCAEPTAGMMAELFADAAGPEKSGTPAAQVLRETGYCLGRWTYLIDAADDLPKDIRRKSFNPFAVKFQLDEKSPPEALKQARYYANSVLNGTLSQLDAAADLLELGCFEPAIRNIIFLGLPMMQRQRLFRKENGNVRSL
jgi:hypothetical protein